MPAPNTVRRWHTNQLERESLSASEGEILASDAKKLQTRPFSGSLQVAVLNHVQDIHEVLGNLAARLVLPSQSDIAHGQIHERAIRADARTQRLLQDVKDHTGDLDLWNWMEEWDSTFRSLSAGYQKLKEEAMSAARALGIQEQLVHEHVKSALFAALWRTDEEERFTGRIRRYSTNVARTIRRLSTAETVRLAYRNLNECRAKSLNELARLRLLHAFPGQCADCPREASDQLP